MRRDAGRRQAWKRAPALGPDRLAAHQTIERGKRRAVVLGGLGIALDRAARQRPGRHARDDVWGGRFRCGLLLHHDQAYPFCVANARGNKNNRTACRA